MVDQHRAITWQVPLPVGQYAKPARASRCYSSSNSWHCSLPSQELRVKEFLKRVTISPNGSPKSAKFSIEEEEESQVEESSSSIRRDAVGGWVSSPVSISPSWRIDDAHYSGVALKIATREVIDLNYHRSVLVGGTQAHLRLG
jgi:hypothetical protein